MENSKKIGLYAKDTFYSGFNLYWVLAILLILTIVQFVKHAFLLGILFAVIFLIAYTYINKFQKEYSYNISLWKKLISDDIFFYIDANSGKLFLTGVEIPFCEIKEIKFTVVEQPKMIGASKQFLEKALINANIEIITGTKTYTTPIQVKKAIKQLEELFKNLNLNTILDVQLYNI